MTRATQFELDELAAMFDLEFPETAEAKVIEEDKELAERRAWIAGAAMVAGLAIAAPACALAVTAGAIGFDLLRGAKDYYARNYRQDGQVHSLRPTREQERELREALRRH